MPHATIKSMQNQNSIALYEISIITHSFVTKLLVYAYNIDVSSITYEHFLMHNSQCTIYSVDRLSQQNKLLIFNS